MKTIKIFVFLSLISVIVFGAEYNVKDYGAVGNGFVLDSKSIQSAINKAHNAGGGVVIIPSGSYKIGTLILKDNVNLHLQIGATLIGSSDIKDYTEVVQKMESRTNKLYSKYFMVFAENAKNIAITGLGIIHGNGAKYFQVTRPQNMRPFLMRLVNCENVTIRNIQMLESANWTFHLLGCRNVTVDGIKIMNTTQGGNRDGLDIDACKDVTVSNCRVSSMDDAIVLKSTNNIICENISITNCILSSDASAIKTGTESNGGFRNITVSNCVINNIPIHAGIELMTVDGGNLENITFSNITMNNVATPIFVYLGNRARPFMKGQFVTKVSDVKDIYFNNITIQNAKLPSGVVGINNSLVQNVSFNNISVRYSETLVVESLAVNSVPYMDLSYPMAIMHGENLPSYAFYCRNVDGLSFKNITVYSAKGEKRPAFVFDKVHNLELFSVKSSTDNLLSPMVYLRNSSKVYSTLCRTLTETELLFQIEKDNCNDLSFVNNFLFIEQKELEYAVSLPETELFAEIKQHRKFTFEKNEKNDGLTAQKISYIPIAIEVEIAKDITPQLCLLIKCNKNNPEKVKITYNGIEQEFLIDWDKWGWAPITLIGPFGTLDKVKLEITSVNKNSELQVSKIYLRNLKLGYTD